MNDGDALLAAIIANPDEDTPRLVYADWLDENGQPERAEFIRLQCAPALDEVGKGRMFELEEWYRAKWLSGLPAETWGLAWEFRRGFPENLTASALSFSREYDAIVLVVWMRSLSLSYLNDSQMQSLAHRPWNPRWVELELQADMSYGGFLHANQGIIAVANCRHVAQLRRLRFSGFQMDPEGLRALATSHHLDNIQQLRLDGVTDQAALAPLRARFGDRLVIALRHPALPKM